MKEETRLQKLNLLLEDIDCVRASSMGTLGYNHTVTRVLGFLRSEVYREVFLEGLDPAEPRRSLPDEVNTSST